MAFVGLAATAVGASVLADAVEGLGDARLVMVVSSLLAVAAIAALGWFVARRVSRPIVRMTETARLVADGDYSQEVEVVSHNEIAELAETFNEMTASLRDRNDALTKKVLELATLYEMSRVLSGTLELAPLLQAVLDSSMRIFDVDTGYVILRDPETGDLDLVAWRDAETRPPQELQLRSSIAEWVVREGRPLIFNPSTEPDGGPTVDNVTGSTTALCVPLVSGEGPIGAVTVGSKDPTLRFSGDDVRLLATIANHATIAIGNMELFSSLQEAYLATVRSLAAAVDAKDPYTRGHSDSVAEYALMLADELELSQDQVRTLEMAAYLHDIGKIGVKESILLKPGTLTTDETSQMRHHPLIGASILKPVVFPWPVAPIIRHHHEWWDGSGYPAGLAGEEIPLLARILGVADAYEAMTADRPYRPGRDTVSAAVELRDFSGSQFDPRIVEAFLTMLEKRGFEPADAERKSEAGVQRDEARAAFSSLCDSMFDSFRRLGGPRLASNVEDRLVERFAALDFPVACSGGRIIVRWDDSIGPEEELYRMQRVIAIVADEMERSAGVSLVEQFYRDAVGGMSARLRRAAVGLPLRD
jgi:putative nucleotidyltransferase with HDIG domain